MNGPMQYLSNTIVLVLIFGPYRLWMSVAVSMRSTKSAPPTANIRQVAALAPESNDNVFRKIVIM